MDIAVCRPRKRGSGTVRAALIGVAFIACGALLELACLPAATAVERIEHHRAHLADLERARADRERRAGVALALSATLDQTWMRYDLDVQQLEMAFDADASAGTPTQPRAARRRIVARLASLSPLAAFDAIDAIDAIGESAPPDVALSAARAAFLDAYGEFHARLAQLAGLLDAGTDVAAPTALDATRALRTLEADVDRRWAAISIAARTASDDDARAADEAERAVDDERAKNVLAVIALP